MALFSNPMNILIAGLIIFFGQHAVPLFPSLKTRIQNRFGASGYHLLFSLVSLTGLVLIVIGYSQARPLSPEYYITEGPIKTVGILLMIPIFVLLIAARLPGNIKRGLRHPMLIAVIIWAGAHLLLNGSLVAILLFGSFFAWAVLGLTVALFRGTRKLEIATDKAVRNDVITIVAGVLLFQFFGGWLHLWLFGIAVF